MRLCACRVRLSNSLYLQVPGFKVGVEGFLAASLPFNVGATDDDDSPRALPKAGPNVRISSLLACNSEKLYCTRVRDVRSRLLCTKKVCVWFHPALTASHA